MKEKILIVDDEENMGALFETILTKEGYEVITALSGEEALQHIQKGGLDLVISDLAMPGMDGIRLLEKVKEARPAPPFIIITAYGTITSAVEAMKKGAYDYITKPFHNEEIKIVIKKALEYYSLTKEVERLRHQVGGMGIGNMIGKSKKMRDLYQLIKIVADSNATILICGESGTGKELVARAIHQNSPRLTHPFVAIDCGAMPETLLESELFGHVRGSFTGAVTTKKGLFEEANGGTIFLDEIADTTLAFQSKLLRVLQEGEIRPVGGNRGIKVNVRVISATNKDLKEAIEKKTFRDDLYYRLAVVCVPIPPLRERKEDIPLLADHFARKYCLETKKEVKRITPEALSLLMQYPWRGNVRELENVIERAILLTPGPEITVHSLLHGETPAEAEAVSLKKVSRESTEQLEREKIIDAITRSHGNKARAAKKLEISRASLYNKIKQYRISFPGKEHTD